MLILITDLLITEYFCVHSKAHHQFHGPTATSTMALEKRVHQASGVVCHFF
jgi:hypothetical protein